jgi:hypothetical protein
MLNRLLLYCGALLMGFVALLRLVNSLGRNVNMKSFVLWKLGKRRPELQKLMTCRHQNFTPLRALLGNKHFVEK